MSDLGQPCAKVRTSAQNAPNFAEMDKEFCTFRTVPKKQTRLARSIYPIRVGANSLVANLGALHAKDQAMKVGANSLITKNTAATIKKKPKTKRNFLSEM